MMKWVSWDLIVGTARSFLWSSYEHSEYRDSCNDAPHSLKQIPATPIDQLDQRCLLSYSAKR